MTKSLYDYCIEREEFKLLGQWDKEKNGPLTTRDISYGSKKKIWWCCEFGHRWQAPAYVRAGQGSGCPYCAGKKIAPGDSSLAAKYPQLVKEWHPIKNVGVTPFDVPPATHRKVWWICERGHEWRAQINSRTRGTGCPICSNRKIFVGENDLATTHPEIAKQWNYEKNGTLTPQKVVAGNSKKVWWRCGYGHEYRSAISSRANGNTGCPACAGKTVIRGENDLESLFPQIAAQWHPTKNGSLRPDMVTVFSNRRAWWVCDQRHEYQTVIAHRTQKASGCPYCSGRKVLQGFNDLETIEPQIAAQWHPKMNGALTPQMVTTGSHKKIWWQCNEGHIWKAVVYSRATGAKCGCPVCAGKVKESRKQRYADVIENGKQNISI